MAIKYTDQYENTHLRRHSRLAPLLCWQTAAAIVAAVALLVTWMIGRGG